MVSTKKASRVAAKKRRASAKARKARVKFRKVLSLHATPSEKRKLQEAARKDRQVAGEARIIAEKRRDKITARRKSH